MTHIIFFLLVTNRTRKFIQMLKLDVCLLDFINRIGLKTSQLYFYYHIFRFGVAVFKGWICR